MKQINEYKKRLAQTAGRIQPVAERIRQSGLHCCQRGARAWLLPAVLILFIVQAMTAPWAIGVTYSGKADSPANILTYSRNRLVWDSKTNIRPDGTAELKLFSAEYNAVKSENGDKVVAPGTSNGEYVRLKNSVKGEIRYTAVLYLIRSDPSLPVKAHLWGEGFADTDRYSLPKGVREDQVVRAVTGTLAGGRIADFGLDWEWLFYEGDAQDAIDTFFGNYGPEHNVVMGLYITVEDDNRYGGDKDDENDGDGGEIKPEQPKTGDESPIEWYFALLGLSFIVLILLLIDRRKDKRTDVK